MAPYCGTIQGGRSFKAVPDNPVPLLGIGLVVSGIAELREEIDGLAWARSDRTRLGQFGPASVAAIRSLPDKPVDDRSSRTPGANSTRISRTSC